jgi:hypothetical protein
MKNIIFFLIHKIVFSILSVIYLYGYIFFIISFGGGEIWFYFVVRDFFLLFLNWL